MAQSLEINKLKRNIEGLKQTVEAIETSAPVEEASRDSAKRKIATQAREISELEKQRLAWKGDWKNWDLWHKARMNMQEN